MESFSINTRDILLLETIADQLARDQSDYFDRHKRSLHLYESYLFEKLFKLKRASHMVIAGILKDNRSKNLNANGQASAIREQAACTTYQGLCIKKYENQKLQVLSHYVSQLEDRTLQKALYAQLSRINQFVKGIEPYQVPKNYVE